MLNTGTNQHGDARDLVRQNATFVERRDRRRHDRGRRSEPQTKRDERRAMSASRPARMRCMTATPT